MTLRLARKPSVLLFYLVWLLLTNDATAMNQFRSQIAVVKDQTTQRQRAKTQAAAAFADENTADVDYYAYEYEQEQQLNDLLQAAYSQGYDVGFKSLFKSMKKKKSKKSAGAGVIDGYRGYVTEYFTDVEGHKRFFEAIIANSEVVQWKDAAAKTELEWTAKHRRNGQLIYGGDVMDRGVGQLEILRALVDFKEKNDANGEADRVILIIGNRDFNKLRLFKELEAKDEFFRNYANFEVHTPTQHKDWESEIAKCEGLSGPAQSVCRSKLILDKTMGAGQAFEHMQSELQQRALQAGRMRTVTDEDVLREFQELIGQGTGNPLMWKYNKLGCFYHYDAVKGILYSHDLPPPTAIAKLKEIDEEATRMVQTYEASPGTFDYEMLHDFVYRRAESKIYSLAGDDFISQILPDKVERPKEQEMRQRFFEAIKAFDAENDIQYYVHGHKPMGELPQVVKLKGKAPGKGQSSVYVIDGDTGYGCFADKIENRGGLHYNIVFKREAGSDVTKAHIKGRLSECQKLERYEFTLPDNGNIGEVRNVEGIGNALIAFQYAGSTANGREVWDFSTNFPSWKFAKSEEKVATGSSTLQDLVRGKSLGIKGKVLEKRRAKEAARSAKSARVDFFDEYADF